MKNISKKLLAIQGEIGTVTKGSINPFYSSSYVEINSLLKAINPILAKHKVCLSQPLTQVEGKPAIETMLIDTESGEDLRGTTVITEIADAQKMGASITYFRRYGVLSILGLGAEDDDGNSLAAKPAGKKKAPAKKTPAKKESTSGATRKAPPSF